MPWSLDWFAAEKLAQAGTPVRRVAWTDKMLTVNGVIWQFLHSDGTLTLVQATEFTSDDFFARDYTDQPFAANPCAAVPAYNNQLVIYGQWTDAPIFIPAPVPGFP